MTVSLGEDFRRVGPEVPFGVSLVSYDEVSPLRELVLGNFVNASSTRATEITFESTARAGALFFRSIGAPGQETPNRSVAARVLDMGEPEGWRLTAKVANYGRASGVTKSKLIYYLVEALDAEVLQSVKAVGFIEEKSELIIAEGELYERFVADRKMYEKPMTGRDCSRLASALGQAARRAPHRTRDPAINNFCWVPGEFEEGIDLLDL